RCVSCRYATRPHAGLGRSWPEGTGGGSRGADHMRAQRSQTKKAAFIEAYAKIGTVFHAAQHVGLPRRRHYKWVQKDPNYARQVAEAEEEAIQHLEREARRRAMVGVEEPVYYKGQVCGAVRKYSDTLLIFLLKSKRPQIYREYQSVDVAMSVNHD